MYLYYDKTRTLKTAISHGEPIRQNSDVNIFVCLDEDFFGEDDDNVIERTTVEASITYENGRIGVNGVSSNNPQLLSFFKLNNSELTNFLRNGEMYWTYQLKFDANQISSYPGKIYFNLEIIYKDGRQYTFSTAELYVEARVGIQDNNIIGTTQYNEIIRRLNILDNKTQNLDGMVNTEDANATAEDLLDGKTAYVQGTKIYGTIINHEGIVKTINQKDTRYNISKGYHNGEGYIEISQSEQDKIIPENIKKGVNILGVEGNNSGSNGQPLEVEELPEVGIEGAFYKMEKTEEVNQVWLYIPGYGSINASEQSGISVKKNDDFPNEPVNDDTCFYYIKNMNNVYVYTQNNWCLASDIFGVPFCGLVSSSEDFSEQGLYIVSSSVVSNINYLFESNKFTEVGDITYKNFADIMLQRNKLWEVTFPSDFVTIPESVFSYMENIKKVTIHKEIKTIEEEAFRDCRNLVSVVFEDGIQLTSIGNFAFRNCGFLEFRIPEGVTELDSTFRCCERLMKIKFPKSLTKITHGTFEGCISLESIEIPSEIRSVLNYVFRDCTSLKTVTLQSTTPPKLEYNSFEGCTALTEIRVPMSAVEAYKKATNWSTYADIIVGYE